MNINLSVKNTSIVNLSFELTLSKLLCPLFVAGLQCTASPVGIELQSHQPTQKNYHLRLFFALNPPTRPLAVAISKALKNKFFNTLKIIILLFVINKFAFIRQNDISLLTE